MQVLAGHERYLKDRIVRGDVNSDEYLLREHQVRVAIYEDMRKADYEGWLELEEMVDE